MNRSEYIQVMSNIEREMDEGKVSAEETLEKLEKLYALKPVLTKYHQVKCKAQMKLGKENAESLISKYEKCVSRICTYEENIVLWKQLIELQEKGGNAWESKLQNYMLNRLLENEKNANSDERLTAALCVEQTEELFSKEKLLELEELFFTSGNVVPALCVYLCLSELYPEAKEVKKDMMYLNRDNMAFLAEQIQAKTPVILVENKNAVIRDCVNILTLVLHHLDIPIYVISTPLIEEGKFDLSDTVSVSVENAQVYEDCIVIPSIGKKAESGMTEDNIPYLLDYLCKNETADDFAMVIAENNVVENLRGDQRISKRFERLNKYETAYMEDKLGFARCGDYLTYCNYLYQTDVRPLLDKKPTCEFSFVIPARNSAKTLEYTLLSCLDQDYQGNYEVLVSDNSVPGNTEVFELCKRLNNPKIHYVHTPRELNLTKSFEFAYFQAEGDFVIPLGSDDGAFSWTLSTLHSVLEQQKQEDILIWERGFYAWPGFNDGQENMFTVVAPRTKGNITASYLESNDGIEAVKRTPDIMYGLPNLYINSGFRRRYLQRKYEAMGCILDASSQDIATGIENLFLYRRILKLEYPLTIAGMSSSSVGAVSTTALSSNNKEEKKKYESCFGSRGIYAYRYTALEERVPCCAEGIDIVLVYLGMQRLQGTSFSHKKNLIKTEDVQIMYEHCFSRIDVFNEFFQKIMEEGKIKIRTWDVGFEDWFRDIIESRMDKITAYDLTKIEELKKQKRYHEGYTPNGGVTLDASRFQVTNVYEATKLYGSFLGFKKMVGDS